MAYITTEKVRNIRNELKREFTNLKFSVKRVNHSKVSITIKSGDLDFIGDYKIDSSDIIGDYIVVSRYHYEKDFKDSEILRALEKINQIAYGQGYYDNSDSMTDYFDTAYYVDIKIGDWDKPYILKKAA